MIAYQLFRPVAFLRVIHEDIEAIRWLIPLAIAAFSTSSLSILYIMFDFDLFSEDGVFERVFGLLGILPGFYIAALAAVATFGHKEMDNLLPKPSPTLTYIERGATEVRELSKRQFVSLLFSFLTFESLFLFIFLSLTLPATSIEILHTPFVKEGIVVLFTFTVTLLLSQLFILTMFGLYFLGDRIHRVTDTERDSTPKVKL